MDADSVHEWVVALGVPPELLSVGVERDGTWCLVPVPPDELVPPGTPSGAWEVFWREHGDRFDWARFTDERVACWYLLGRLAHSQLVRGALQVVPPAAPAQEPLSETP